MSLKPIKPKMKEEIITFHKPWNINEQKEPSCFNGEVRVRKFKITIEELEEPIGVYEERLQKLWEGSKNWHEREPLQKAAKEINYELKGGQGGKEYA